MVKRALLCLGLLGCSKDFEDYRNKSKAIEAKVGLQLLERSIKAHASEATPPSVPILDLGPTPAVACCAQPGGVCPYDATIWKDWVPLAFEIFQAPRFQYTYTSKDGKSFTATATGDTDCDGTKIVYRLTGTVDAAGVVTTNLEAPTNAD